MALIEVTEGTLGELLDPQSSDIKISTYDIPYVQKIQPAEFPLTIINTPSRVLLTFSADTVAMVLGSGEPKNTKWVEAKILVNLTKAVQRLTLITERGTDSLERKAVLVRLVGPGEETAVTADLIPPRPDLRRKIILPFINFN